MSIDGGITRGAAAGRRAQQAREAMKAATMRLATLRREGGGAEDSSPSLQSSSEPMSERAARTLRRWGVGAVLHSSVCRTVEQELLGELDVTGGEHDVSKAQHVDIVTAICIGVVGIDGLGLGLGGRRLRLERLGELSLRFDRLVAVHVDRASDGCLG
jgi:hypothetical protein